MILLGNRWRVAWVGLRRGPKCAEALVDGGAAGATLRTAAAIPTAPVSYLLSRKIRACMLSCPA